MTVSDPFTALEVERARIERCYAALTDDGWHEPTRCDGWNRRDLLVHLVGVEAYTRACLDDDVDGLSDGLLDPHRADDADEPGATVLGRWLDVSEDNQARLRERAADDGADATMATSAGDYPLERQAWYLASELAIHADDAGAAVTDDERADRRRWRAAFGRDALGETAPEVDVEVVDDDQGAAVCHVRIGDDTAMLGEAEFVEAVSGRLPESADVPERLRTALVALA